LSANSSIHLTNRSVHFSRRPGSDSANPSIHSTIRFVHPCKRAGSDSANSSAQPANLVPNSLIFSLTRPHSPPAHWRTFSLHVESLPGIACAWETIHLPNLVANSVSFRRTSPHSPPAHLTNSAVHSGRSPSFAVNLRPISTTQST